MIRQAWKEHERFQQGDKIFGHCFLTPRVFGPEGTGPREKPSVQTASLTCGEPRAALPGHGAVLLAFVSAHTQEGPFHIFTEGFTAHTTEQFTFVHIWKREHRPSQMCSPRLTTLCFTSCAMTGGVCGNKGTPPTPGTIKPFSFGGEGALLAVLQALVCWTGQGKHNARIANSHSGFKEELKTVPQASHVHFV